MVESIYDRQAGPGKGFYCETGQTFNTIRELEQALLNCSSTDSQKIFDAHTAGYKNDFASWIGDVFGMQNLARRIFPTKNAEELSKEIRNYESEFIQKSEQSDINYKDIQKEEIKKQEEINRNKMEAKEHTSGNEKSIVNTVQSGNMADLNLDIRPAIDNANVNINMDALRNEMNDRSDRAEHTFDRVKKLKQHSFFNKADFEDTIEVVKDRYEELMRAVAQNRKDGKDMSIPAMMLRNVHPKINYFQVSQNKLDYDMIINLLDDIEQEIKFEQGVKKKDLKEEIMEALGFSKIKKEDE